MGNSGTVVEAIELRKGGGAVVFDCRFSLADSEAGAELYRTGHVPGAHYLHLERDMSGPVSRHGGRHPLPDPEIFVALLRTYGVGPDTEVVAYDDSRMAFAARLWWLMKSLGYRPPRLLNGGYRGWLAAGGDVEGGGTPAAKAPAPQVAKTRGYTGICDIHGLRVAQGGGAVLVDSREERRYQGLEEPIDPVAGHIPGARNRPWQGVTDTAGNMLGEEAQRLHWGSLLEEEKLVVYCGSGVTACVNLFSLAGLGRDDALLYPGSWSDWCSYL